MALFSECRPQCAQTVLDTADIVRDGDVTSTTRAVLKPRQVQKEKCGVHPLRTWFIGFALRRDYAAFASLRSDLKPARTSSEKSCGCSQAAKWPPFSTLL